MLHSECMDYIVFQTEIQLSSCMLNRKRKMYTSIWNINHAINRDLFSNKTRGLYIGIGAYNGESIENTLFFRHIGWTGLCIEPIRDYYNKYLTMSKCSPVYKSSSWTIEYTPCINTFSLSKHIDIDHINYMSIDTYGSELDILHGIDFTKTRIDVISVNIPFHSIDYKNIETFLSLHLFSLYAMINTVYIFTHS